MQRHFVHSADVECAAPTREEHQSMQTQRALTTVHILYTVQRNMQTNFSADVESDLYRSRRGVCSRLKSDGRKNIVQMYRSRVSARGQCDAS
jgi:hypothetical protein